jgi:dTDP-4-dehydrorhamnose reductase
MRIVITGAGGMLGQDVGVAARAAGHDVTGLTRADLDITDGARVTTALTELQPEAVINCAAFTRVDAAESAAATAQAINSDGAANVAAATAAAGAWLIHVSTDYVFDGAKTTGPYLESDSTNPQSVYGATKLAGEIAIAETAPAQHSIVRTSWLFGTGGPCFPETMLRLAAERDELRVVADQRGCPTFTPHLAQALVDLAVSQALPGTLHVAASGDCTWHEFATATITASGNSRTTVTPITTADYPTPATRPAYSVLRSERGAPGLPHWRDGLMTYLRDIERTRT